MRRFSNVSRTFEDLPVAQPVNIFQDDDIYEGQQPQPSKNKKPPLPIPKYHTKKQTGQGIQLRTMKDGRLNLSNLQVRKNHQNSIDGRKSYLPAMDLTGVGPLSCNNSRLTKGKRLKFALIKGTGTPGNYGRKTVGGKI